jgi:hypothetical protein
MALTDVPIVTSHAKDRNNGGHSKDGGHEP